MIFSSPSNKRGLTLIELLIVIAIVGILAGLAVPNYATFIAERSVASETRRLIGALKLARSEARARGAVVTLARTGNGWDSRIDIYEDTSGANSAFAAPDDLVRTEEPGGRTVQALDDQGNTDPWISFNMRGWLSEAGPVLIAVCASQLDDARGMYIAINRVGKIRERRIDNDSRGCNP